MPVMHPLLSTILTEKSRVENSNLYDLYRCNPLKMVPEIAQAVNYVRGGPRFGDADERYATQFASEKYSEVSGAMGDGSLVRLDGLLYDWMRDTLGHEYDDSFPGLMDQVARGAGTTTLNRSLYNKLLMGRRV